jgi:hypothetical protein
MEFRHIEHGPGRLKKDRPESCALPSVAPCYREMCIFPRKCEYLEALDIFAKKMEEEQ